MACVLYRRSITPAEEIEAAGKFFPLYDNVVGVENELVVARYSALPFYTEIEEGLRMQGSRLLNTHAQHRYIADFDYYYDLEEMTPKTWFYLHEVPKKGGPFVLKGRTNSLKHDWKTKMYAETFEDAVRVHGRLLEDSLVGQQEILVREFVPLNVLEVGLSGLPMSNEWRFFFLGETLLSHGFYWTISEKEGTMNEEGMEFARRAAKILAQKTNFFVLDIAEKASGGWTVIEVNDGQMAGLSGNDPEHFYGALHRALSEDQAI